MPKPDLTYRDDGMFVRFYAETPAGADAWRELAREDGVAAVLAPHLPAVLRQLRSAGYSVRRAARVKVSDDALLRELGA